MKKKYCDVVIALWDMEGRDAFATIPVYHLLKYRMGMSVKLVSVFNPLAILKLKPRILYLNGLAGARVGIRIAKLAKANNIKVINSTSEGMIETEDRVEQNFWGHIPNNEICFDKYFLWNECTKRWTLNKYSSHLPEDIIDVSGSIGHERYRYLKCQHLAGELKQNRYKNIILYCGHGFDAPHIQSDTREDYRYWMDNTMRLLRSVAESFSDSLIIMKPHPHVVSKEFCEVERHYDDLPNVLITRGEIPIHNLVLSADLILVFNSSIALDAWLTGKTTICLYSGNVYSYGDMRNGSFIAKDEHHLSAAINEYFNNGSIAEFDAKKTIREEVMKKYLACHIPSPSLHVANYIRQLNTHLQNSPRKSGSHYTFRLFLSSFVNLLFYHCRFLPKIPRFSMMRTYFNLKRYLSLHGEMKNYLDEYYDNEKFHV